MVTIQCYLHAVLVVNSLALPLTDLDILKILMEDLRLISRVEIQTIKTMALNVIITLIKRNLI